MGCSAETPTVVRVRRRRVEERRDGVMVLGEVGGNTAERVCLWFVVD